MAATSTYVRVLTAALLLAAAPSAASSSVVAARPSRPAPAVIAVVAEYGVNPLHQEFATADGRSVALPAPAARVAVRVPLPRGGDFRQRLATLRRGPLGAPRDRTLYYVEGTRLLVYVDGSRPPADLLTDFHGTATASLAGGRSVGAARDALVLVVVGAPEPSWSWVAQQDWVDAASASTFEVLPGGVACSGISGVTALRARGRLAFAAAGNTAPDTSVVAPAGHPAVVRVGGVTADGASAVPGSGRAYDVAELLTNQVAAADSADGYAHASGTSGSAPLVAGRVAAVLSAVRAVVGDRAAGVRDGALVRAASSRRPGRGPLSDGRLTAEELLSTVLAMSTPHAPPAPGRYLAEGYGWFDEAAARRTVDVLLGRATAPVRPQDDAERAAALQARAVAFGVRGCR